MSLRAKVFIRSAVLSAFLIGVIVATHLAYVRDFSDRQLDQRYTKETIIQAARAERLVLWDDRVALTGLLESMLDTDDHLAYAFIERDGRPYAHTFTDGVPRLLLGRPVSPTPQHWHFSDEAGERFHDVSVRVGDTNAVLHVGLSREKGFGDVVPLLTRIAAVGGVTLLAAVVLSMLLARWTTREVRSATVALRDTLAFMQTIIDGVPEALMVINRDCTIALANRTVREMTGGKDPVAGRLKCHQVSHQSATPCAATEHPCPLGLVIATKATATVEHLHRDAEGNDLLVEVIAAPIFDEKGEVVQIIELARDLTERIRAEEGRRELEAQFQQAQKLESLGVLASGLAHDFNNLLVGIYGNMDLALMDLEERSPVRIYITDAKTAARRAADLIGEMLAYAGKGKTRSEEVDLHELLQEMAGLLRASISRKTTIHLDLAEGLVAVRGDPTQIRQVVMNIITNAGQAIGEEVGEIVVRTERIECDRAFLQAIRPDVELPEGPYISLQIADTGSGLSREVMGRIFDPFFTTKATGSGLGLSAVHGIVRSHGGAIRVESQPGKGTSFTILLPTVLQLTGTGQIDLVAKDWRGSGTILVVDDEEPVRSFVAKAVERFGFAVLIASDGVEAVEIFREHHGEIDGVLLDLKMPRMDGAETFEELREICADVLVILSSGFTEEESTRQFAGKGLAGFIQKPYEAAALREKLRVALGRRSGA